MRRAPGLNSAACIIKDGATILTSMTFPDCFQLAVAATVSLSALSVYPQSTRAAEMDSGTTITSLTSLHGSRHASTPFGAIDATANDGVMLDVSVAPDLTSAENLNQLQAGRGSGHSRLSGSIPSQPVTLSSLPGSSSQALKGGSLRSQRGVSLDSLQSAASRALHAPVVGNIPQTGSNPNAPPASNGSRLQPYGEVHPGRDFSGSHRPTSDLYSSHSYRSILGDASAHSSRSDQSDSDSNQFDSQSASDVSSEDADTLNVDASTSESSTTAADRQGAQGVFEVIGDPFGNLFQGGFAGRGKGFTSDTSESGSSIQSSQRGALELSGKEPNSQLHHKNGRLSNDAPGSGSQAQRRLSDSNEVEHGSSDSVVLRRSPN
jgi:hypothetical protein